MIRILALALLLVPISAEAQTAAAALQARALALRLQASVAQAQAAAAAAQSAAKAAQDAAAAAQSTATTANTNASSANTQAQAAYSKAATAITATDANQLIGAATAGLAPASALPGPCTAVPAADTTMGSVGTSTPCSIRPDASRPAVVQTATATGGGVIVTDATGSFSGIWPRAWTTAPSYAHAEVYTTSTPIICMIGSATTTIVSGKCFALVQTTLGSNLTALVNQVVSPFANAASGLAVKAVGRQ